MRDTPIPAVYGLAHEVKPDKDSRLEHRESLPDCRLHLVHRRPPAGGLQAVIVRAGHPAVHAPAPPGVHPGANAGQGPGCRQGQRRQDRGNTGGAAAAGLG